MTALNDLKAAETQTATAHASVISSIEASMSAMVAEINKVSGTTYHSAESVFSKVESWMRSEGRFVEEEISAAMTKIRSLF